MSTAAADSARKLAAPQGVQPLRISWIDTTGIVAVHLAALLIFVPWFFSWTGVVLAVGGLYLFGTLGIGLCFHRLLTHRGFVCPKWLEYSLAIIGVCCLQDTPARWVATHRRHHAHSDEQPDPHSPLVNFLWSHVGWLMFKNRELLRLTLCQRYARDLLDERFYVRLEKKMFWVQVVLMSWAVFFILGLGAALAAGVSLLDALQFALSVLVWGVFLRTVLVWHITWSVNSVTHLWGYRNYETGEGSRNNLVVGLLACGEGWHNNHHAYPRSAQHGHKWWELDLTWITIRFLEILGLATKVVRTTSHGAARQLDARTIPVPTVIPVPTDRV